MNIFDMLPVIIPSTIAVAGTIVGYSLLRKSSREGNEVRKFEVLTKTLFEDNASVREENRLVRAEMQELRKRLGAIEAGVAAKDRQIHTLELEFIELEREAEETDSKMTWLTTVTNQMASYIERLIQEWPGTLAPPAPEPHVAWRDYL